MPAKGDRPAGLIFLRLLPDMLAAPGFAQALPCTGVQDRVAVEPGADAEQALDRGEGEDHRGHHLPGRDVHQRGTQRHQYKINRGLYVTVSPPFCWAHGKGLLTGMRRMVTRSAWYPESAANQSAPHRPGHAADADPRGGQDRSLSRVLTDER